jgi:hypothetical protein
MHLPPSSSTFRIIRHSWLQNDGAAAFRGCQSVDASAEVCLASSLSSTHDVITATPFP